MRVLIVPKKITNFLKISLAARQSFIRGESREDTTPHFASYQASSISDFGKNYELRFYTLEASRDFFLGETSW